jgi:hypothetical protein
MSSSEWTQLDHATSGLSTDPAQARRGSSPARPSEADNALRYAGASPGRERPRGGHVESHFLKANSPDGRRALWVKHTLLVPTKPDADPVAELWAIAFDERGRRKLAQKATYPISAARFSEAPFSFTLPAAELRHGAARGALGELAWDLRYAAATPSFRPFGLPGMYTGAFPRSKSLTPIPDTCVFGSFSAFGERWQLDGWRGAQGHNWGKSHAHAYAWTHGNAWSLTPGGPPLPGVWLEALSGRVRLGPIVTPWLSVAGVHYAGRLFRFDRAAAILSRAIAIDTRRYHFTLRQHGVTLRAELEAEREQFAGLRYVDPDGRSLACLNSKLARGRLTLSYDGVSVVLHTEQAALELGTRRAGHQIALLA